MKTLLPLSLAVLSSLAVAPAFAQDAVATDSATTSYTDNDSSSASGKHWAVVGGIASMKTKSNPMPGTRVNGDWAPTLSVNWYPVDNFAVELWGAAGKFEHDVRTGEGKIGTVKEQPVALSAQYHFGAADNVFRPFVGVGYYESNFSDEKINALADGGHVGLDKAKGAIGTVGVDMNINSTWFARADARYLRSRPDLTVNGDRTGQEMKLDPWTLGIGIGARF